MSISENDIVKGCVSGDRRAQKALYEIYKNQMFTLAYRITGNREDAEDVLVEGFMKVFDYLRTFKNQSALSTWIHTIIARTAYAVIKNRIYFEDIEEHEGNAMDLSELPTDISHLERAIMELPDGYRTVFTLYEIEGYKHREIAEILEISDNTSKSQLSKAKSLLREKLEKI
jgi:RNA polymerase sigma-70 factor (ECF subfamily)